MVRLLWLHSDKAGCGTYRAYIPGLTLEAEGYDNNFLLQAGMQPGAVDRDGTNQLANIDVVLFQRCFGPRALEWARLCKTRGIATIVEMDDDLFSVPADNPAAKTWASKAAQQSVIDLCGVVDHVIVSTRPLAWSVENNCHVPKAKITIAQNHLHRAVWPAQLLSDPQHAKTDPAQIIIGWQGSMTHDGDFTAAVSALVKILDEFPQVLLRFFGSVPLTLRGRIPEKRFQWSHGVPFEQYPAALRYAAFDIGIAPLTDNTFNQAKSHLKWMEYSALQIPCVASDVYPYTNAIDHEQTGLLVKTPHDWYTALRALITDPEYRVEIGQRAYTHVWQQWTPAQHIMSWKTAIATALATAKET